MKTTINTKHWNIFLIRLGLSWTISIIKFSIIKISYQTKQIQITSASTVNQKIVRRTTGVKGCFFLAGFLQVSNIFIKYILQVSYKYPTSILQISNKYFTSILQFA